MIRKELRPHEILTIFFAALFLSIAILFRERIERLFYLVPLYLSIIAFQFVRFPDLPFWSRRSLPFKGSDNNNIGREFLVPIISVVFIFDSLGWIVHPVNPVDIDPILLKLDYLLTGTYPTVALQRFVNPFLTEVLQLAYTSYYFIPVILGITLKIHKKEKEFNEALFMVLLCFYLSYVGYLLFPALGPRFYIKELHTVELKGILLMEPIHELLNRLEGIKRDAFPSGHTAIALLCLVIAYKHERGLFWWLAPVVTMLVFSTVYLRYHYVVDVLAGIALTGLVLIAGPYLLQRLQAE